MRDQPPSRLLTCGAIGGLVAGLVVALWFLATDLAAGAAFETPARLGSLWLGEAYAGPTMLLVAIYTSLHLAAFGGIGVATVVFLRTLGLEPRLTSGLVVGVGVLNAVYYGGRLVHGADLLNALPWVHVLGANLLGGMAMMTYLHRALDSQSPLGIRMLERYPILLKGLATGLLGAGAVALWFLLVDVVTGEPFYTPAALGSVVFLGATDAAAVEVSVAIVGAYTMLHVLAFWAVGVAFVWVAEAVQESPGWWLAAVLAFIVLEGLFLGTIGQASEWVLGTLGWAAVGIGNLLAVVAMGWRVWATHPILRQRLAEPALETRV